MESDELKDKIGIKDDGTYRVNPETGVVEKHGLFGWSQTDTKINQESGNVESYGIFGWRQTDTRINPESGVVQKETCFGSVNTDKRIDPDTGAIQDRGWFGWRDTGERIDPETGNHQRQGLFGYYGGGGSPANSGRAGTTKIKSNANHGQLARGSSASGGGYYSKSARHGKPQLAIVFWLSLFAVLLVALQERGSSGRPSESIIRQLFWTRASNSARVKRVFYYKSFFASGEQYEAERGIPAGTEVFPVMVCYTTEQYPFGLDPFHRNVDLGLQRVFRDFLLLLPVPDHVKPACEPDFSSWRWLFVDSSRRWNIVSDPRGGV